VKTDPLWFDSVWYRKTGKRGFFEFAPQDVGSLSVDKGTLGFTGNLIRLDGMRVVEVELRRIAGDFLNLWVKVKLESPADGIQDAYFADGRHMGWSGILGGTKRIFEAIKLSGRQE